MSIQDAFFQVCDAAKQATRSYVSLYVNTPYYGGPEEGGWWGNDCTLIAYQECNSEQEAEEKREAVLQLADELNKDALREYGEYCNTTMEWLEARGLDADYLPEVDGEVSYSVVIEQSPGECSSQGPRHYE